MPEETETPFTAQDIINDLYGGDTTEEEGESQQAQEGTTEVLAGDEEETTQEPEVEEESSPEGDEYDKIEDPVKLRERLRMKDRGYQKREQETAIPLKTGMMITDALNPDNPKREEAKAALLKELGLEAGTVTKPGELPQAETPDFSEWETTDEAGNVTNEAKDHFEKVVVPYTRDLVVKAVESLRRELRSEIDEPLSEYKNSREKAAFESRVDAEWPTAQKIMNLAKVEATRDDLKAAMQEFRPLLEAGSHKPHEVLKLYKLGAKTEPAKVKKDLPGMPKSETNGRKSSAEESVNDRVDKWFDARIAK